MKINRNLISFAAGITSSVVGYYNSYLQESKVKKSVSLTIGGLGIVLSGISLFRMAESRKENKEENRHKEIEPQVDTTQEKEAIIGREKEWVRTVSSDKESSYRTI